MDNGLNIHPKPSPNLNLEEILDEAKNELCHCQIDEYFRVTKPVVPRSLMPTFSQLRMEFISQPGINTNMFIQRLNTFSQEIRDRSSPTDF